MAYKLRIEVPCIYHVTTRGNNKRTIFLTDRDRLVFISLLNRIATKHGWTIYAFCLMTNHYHLLMRIDERGMSRGLCELNSQYALLFNQSHARVNHLFGKRYWSEQIKTDERFRRACRYVVRNPVEAGLVEHPADYVWSSYRATVGVALGHVRVAVDELLAMFHHDRATAIAKFKALCDPPDPPGHVRWQPP